MRPLLIASGVIVGLVAVIFAVGWVALTVLELTLLADAGERLADEIADALPTLLPIPTPTPAR